MSDIKTIGASWDCESEKTEVYRLLNMIHAMAGQEATQSGKSWSLGATSTQDDYVMTEWTNGIVRITAETYKDFDGSVCSHYYQLAKARGE